MTCSICNLPIAAGETYFTGSIDQDAAAKLLDTDKPELVPTWEQLPDGMVRLTFREACVRDLNCGQPRGLGFRWQVRVPSGMS